MCSAGGCRGVAMLGRTVLGGRIKLCCDLLYFSSPLILSFSCPTVVCCRFRFRLSVASGSD